MTGMTTEFVESVRTYFDFPIKDFGFTLTSDSVDGVRYDAATLYVAIWSSKGEIDLAFGLKVDPNVIRPYVSHMFDLAAVLQERPVPRFQAFPAVPGTAEEERYLIYLATLTKKYWVDILRGDLTPPEKLSQNPGAPGHASAAAGAC